MKHTRKILETIRNPYAWPGGYPIYFFDTVNGDALSINYVRDNLASILRDIKGGYADLMPVINWEDAGLYCGGSGEQIECAYSDE